MIIVKVLIIVYLGMIYVCKPFCIFKWIFVFFFCKIYISVL